MNSVPDAAAWAAFIAAWRRNHGAEPVSVRELLTLPEAMPLLEKYPAQHQRLVSLGRMLGAERGQQVRRVQWARSRRRKDALHYIPATWALAEPGSESTGSVHGGNGCEE